MVTTPARLALFLGLALVLAGCPDSVGDGHGSSGPSIAAPTSLTGAPGAGPVNLSWVDASSNESGFRLEVGTSPFGAPPYWDVVFLPANTSAYKYTGPPNTLLYFRLYAITASEQSAPSNVVSVTTPNVPNAPTFFTALPISTTQVELQWVAPGNQGGYRIQLYDSNTATWGAPVTVGAASISYVYVLPYVIPAQFPLFRITPYNGIGDGLPAQASAMSFSKPFTSFPGLSPGGSFDYGGHTSLAIAPNGDWYCSFYDWTNFGLWYTQIIPGVATGVNNIDSAAGMPDAAGFDGTSLDIDGAGKVHVASNFHYQDDLRYVTNASGNWVATTVDINGGKHPALKVAPNGSVHIVYQVSNTLYYGIKSAGMPWSISNIPIAVRANSVHSLVIDSAGWGHVILVQDIGSALWHWSAGNFQMIASGGSYEHTSVLKDGAGALHVAYNDASTGSLMVATNASGSWTNQIAHAHSRGNLGRHNSMTMDGAGTLYISYYDAVYGNLWQARKPPGSSVFGTMLVLWSGDVGRTTSTAFDGANVVTSCYSPSQKQLIFVKVAQ